MAGAAGTGETFCDIATVMLGSDASDEEYERFKQDARYRSISLRKPFAVMNEQKGEAYVTLSLCEYDGRVIICNVPEYGFSETADYERVTDIFVDVVNGGAEQDYPEVTIGANFQKGAQGEAVRITSTFVPEEQP